jgi:hypothetical protein
MFGLDETVDNLFKDISIQEGHIVLKKLLNQNKVAINWEQDYNDR